MDNNDYTSTDFTTTDFGSGGIDLGNNNNNTASNDYNVNLALNNNDNSGGGGGGGGDAPSYNFSLNLPDMEKPLQHLSSFMSGHSHHSSHSHSSDTKTPPTPNSPPPVPVLSYQPGTQPIQPQYTGAPAPMYSPPGSALLQQQQQQQHQQYTVAPMSVQYTGQQHPGMSPPMSPQPQMSPHGMSQPMMSPQHGMSPQPMSPQSTGMHPQQGMHPQPGMPGQPGMPSQPGQFQPGMVPQPGMPGYHPGMVQVQHQGVTIQQPALQHNVTGGTIPMQAHTTGGTPMGVPQPGMTQASQIGSQYQQEMWARCARGEHDIQTKYGVVGIIMAIALFPIGLTCLFIDAERKCTRCGYRAA